jgi:hypothetical protein
MTIATIGYGAAFQTTDGAGGWLTVAESISMTLPPITRDAIDASHECKPNEWRDSIPGLKNGGEVGIDMNFTNAQYIALAAELDSNTPLARRIVFPDGAIFPFNAFLIGLEASVTVADKRAASARFKVVGEPGPLTIP